MWVDLVMEYVTDYIIQASGKAPGLNCPGFNENNGVTVLNSSDPLEIPA